jgi:hypothetical protein
MPKVRGNHHSNVGAGLAHSVWRAGYGGGRLRNGFQFPAGTREFSFPHSAQTGSGTRECRGTYPSGKATMT